jgi:hypothetical protein
MELKEWMNATAHRRKNTEEREKHDGYNFAFLDKGSKKEIRQRF